MVEDPWQEGITQVKRSGRRHGVCRVSAVASSDFRKG